MASDDRAVVLLLSGGVDSSTVALYLRDHGYRVLPRFVAYGQQAAAGEWKAVRAVARALALERPESIALTAFGRGLAFPMLQGLPRGPRATMAQRTRASFVPHRNLLLATCAAMHAASCGVSAIALGVVGGAHVSYADTTSTFVQRLQRLLRMSADVRVIAPFVRKTKADVARYGWERDFDYGMTYSCHRQSGMHCGRCAGCIERHVTLASYPSPTPTRYAHRVVWPA